MNNKIYYYNWQHEHHIQGTVIGFLSKKEARKHAEENHPKKNNLNKKNVEIIKLKEGEILDIYNG